MKTTGCIGIHIQNEDSWMYWITYADWQPDAVRCWYRTETTVCTEITASGMRDTEYTNRRWINQLHLYWLVWWCCAVRPRDDTLRCAIVMRVVAQCQKVRHHDGVAWPTTGPWTSPMLVLQTVRYIAFPFNLQYPLFSSRSPSTLLLLSSHPSITSILPSIF
jgi:hypothetical protein